MTRNNRIIKVILGFAISLLLAISFVSCSEQKEATSSVSTSTVGSVSQVWAKDFGPGQLDAHYLKHKHEFGDILKQEYLSNARILLNSAPGKDILEKRRTNGDVLHYRVSTGEFAVMAVDGRIRTYFKTDYNYWLRQ